jgi:hypothetical protein
MALMIDLHLPSLNIGRHEVGKHAGHFGTRVEGIKDNRGFLRGKAM